ncbi:MAG: 16S rRNA (adenine(1518)-N(6)/adenine(1519)-N(6))-dimethyltransferase RsmA [Patescibacteria group bacterium]
MGQKLGQHFLKNKKILHTIAGIVESRADETLIEVGPGHGELTEKLKTQNAKCKIIAIEKDKILAEQLEKKFEKDKNIKIMCGDALLLLPEIVKKIRGNYIVVGNIPYYITGYLFRTIQELKKRPTRTVVMIQKEVAERIVKKSPQMNLLAASVQYWADPKIIMNVSKKEFSPQPKIDSAVIELYTKKTHLKNNGGVEKKYYNTLNILFKQPRKTIKNNITLSYRTARGCNTQEKVVLKQIEEISVHAEGRPQDLRIEEIKKIAQIIHPK